MIDAGEEHIDFGFYGDMTFVACEREELHLVEVLQREGLIEVWKQWDPSGYRVFTPIPCITELPRRD